MSDHRLRFLSSPPPAGTQIWPAMNLLTLVRVGCRMTVISWWIVRRSITINDALITHHQFPTARVPRWKLRADHDLCAGRRPAAQQCRNHSQNQNQPLHLSSSQPAIPEHIRSISVPISHKICSQHRVVLVACSFQWSLSQVASIKNQGPPPPRPQASARPTASEKKISGLSRHFFSIRLTKSGTSWGLMASSFILRRALNWCRGRRCYGRLQTRIAGC
jgi:hypothetical protein